MTVHDQASSMVERLRTAHPNSAQKNAGSNILIEAATLIESLSKALSEAEAERDRQISRCAALVKLDEWSSNQTKNLVANKTEWMDRALAAESRLAGAMKVIEELLKNACAAAQVMPSGIHRIDATEEEWLSHLDACHSARRFLNAGKE